MAETTPYSTVMPFVGSKPSWVPEADQERIAAYFKYDDFYWNQVNAFQLQQRGEEESIYVPNPMTIVDSTAHYLMKGLDIGIEDPEANADLDAALKAFIKRERFYSKFHIGKHAGVARGDYLFHLTADPLAAEGERLSFTSVLPHNYFPEYDPDDLDKVIAVNLVEQFVDPRDNKTYIRKLHYWYEGEGEARKVWREEGAFEVKDWFDPKKQKQVQSILKKEVLPDPIRRIPVYHFKNQSWDGDPYGRSELAGLETVIAGVNQTVSDEDLALALQGLGVFATDAGGPLDADGNETDWEIAPARVMEVPTGSFFKRVEGVGSVTPSLDHIHYLEEKMYEGAGVSDVALGKIDVQTAESGIALAIRFMPTLAKIEERDIAGVELLTNFWYDWKAFHTAYEAENFEDAPDILVTLGEKLPVNRTAVLNELNNMLDRKVISKKYYRSVMTSRLGYEFPDNIADEILQEQIDALQILAAQTAITAPAQDNQGSQQQGDQPPPTSGGDPRITKKGSTAPDGGNKSNNKNGPNESGGTEAGQSSAQQTKA